MTNCIINDVPGRMDAQSELSEFGVFVLDAEKMTKKLLDFTFWPEMDPWQTLIIMPGNGANILRQYIEHIDRYWLWQWPWKSNPPAKRIWIPGQNPFAITGRITTGYYLGIQQVIIMDDVVSSGETCRKVRKLNLPHIPNAKWRIVTWVRQVSANTNGFVEINSCENVGNIDSKVPINSLSTLLQSPVIAQNYAERNFGERAISFLRLLKKYSD